MVIENAPFLERLLVSDLEGPTKIRVIDAPKLTALVYSSAKFSELFIGSVIVQVQHSSSSPLFEIHIFKFLLDVFTTVFQKMIPTSLT